GEEDRPGPILSLASTRAFDEIVLFSTPNTEKITADTAKSLSKVAPSARVQTIDLPLLDPTDYRAILVELRKHLPTLLEKGAGDEIFVAVASGTPQMHACWLMLAASGELPAKILHIRPPRFVTEDSPLVAEVDFTAPEFPDVRYRLPGPDIDSGGPIDAAA